MWIDTFFLLSLWVYLFLAPAHNSANFIWFVCAQIFAYSACVYCNTSCVQIQPKERERNENIWRNRLTIPSDWHKEIDFCSQKSVARILNAHLSGNSNGIEYLFRAREYKNNSRNEQIVFARREKKGEISDWSCIQWRAKCVRQVIPITKRPSIECVTWNDEVVCIGNSRKMLILIRGRLYLTWTHIQAHDTLQEKIAPKLNYPMVFDFALVFVFRSALFHHRYAVGRLSAHKTMIEPSLPINTILSMWTRVGIKPNNNKKQQLYKTVFHLYYLCRYAVLRLK